jgi:hypothetical protein
MGLWDKYLLPRLVHFTCGQKPAMKQREKVVPRAADRLLEASGCNSTDTKTMYIPGWKSSFFNYLGAVTYG